MNKKAAKKNILSENALQNALQNTLPKYIQLKNYIQDSITKGRFNYGERINSEHELSSNFNISRHTVRQAIGDLVNEGWIYRVQGKGTFVNRVKEQKESISKLIGVVTTSISDYIFPSIIKGIDTVLSEKNYSMLLGYTEHSQEKESACLLNLLDKNVDGLIIEPTKSSIPNSNIGIYEEFANRNIPIIFIHGYYSDFQSSYVVEDDELAGYLAANHLLELGHENIFGIFKIDDVQGHGRYKGMLKAYKEKGMVHRENSVLWYNTDEIKTIFNNKNMEYFRKKLVGHTSIICYNDQIALKMMEIMRNLEVKIPDMISLVSFDDSEIATVTELKLTTVAHPKEELGSKAAEGMLDLISGKKLKIKESIQPILIVRDSTKAC